MVLNTSVLIIDDGYFRENYPLPFQTNAKNLEAIIRMTQKIQMRSILGDILYSEVVRYIENPDAENPVHEAIEEIRMLHCLYVAKALYTSYYKDGDKDIRDYNISYIEGDIKTLESYMISSVKANAQLSDYTQVDSDNPFDDDYQSYGTVYYPNDEE
jgi:hypothetical protein